MKKVIAFSQEQSYYDFDYYSMEESFDESCQKAEQKIAQARDLPGEPGADVTSLRKSNIAHI